MIRFIIVLAIFVVALSYFGVSIRHIVESPTGQDNFGFVWQIILNGWNLVLHWITTLINAIKHVFA